MTEQLQSSVVVERRARSMGGVDPLRADVCMMVLPVPGKISTKMSESHRATEK